MKLYTFTHMKLSPQAKSIQAQHSLVKMFVKYENEQSIPRDLLYSWARDFDTIVLLNGGNSPELKELMSFLDVAENREFPWSFFLEDESLDGILTSISVLVSSKIHGLVSLIREKRVRLEDDHFFVIKESDRAEIVPYIEDFGDYSAFDIELIDRLSKYRMSQ